MALTLVEPVNIYSQDDRASKYGVLFVMLTFVSFFMFELLKRLAIHPIQYGLVGLADAVRHPGGTDDAHPPHRLVCAGRR